MGVYGIPDFEALKKSLAESLSKRPAYTEREERGRALAKRRADAWQWFYEYAIEIEKGTPDISRRATLGEKISETMFQEKVKARNRSASEVGNIRTAKRTRVQEFLTHAGSKHEDLIR